MKRVPLLLAIIAVSISAIYSVRIGALVLAGALAIFAIPGIKNRRRIEQLFAIAVIVSLITVALALPRR
jgi:hypothetical protein